MEKIRCFVAVDFPAEVKETLVQVRNQLKAWPGRVKWVEEENYHLTLKFLGDVPAGYIPVIIENLRVAAARHAEFPLALTNIGAFPNLNRPRVIWCGLGDETGTLQLLHNDIDKELRLPGIPGETGPYRPHLTLGRVKEPGPSIAGPPTSRSSTGGPSIGGPSLADLVKGLAPINAGPALIREIVLYESRLSRFGPTYLKLAEFALAK